MDDNVIRLASSGTTSGPEKNDVASWLRAMADQVDSGELGKDMHDGGTGSVISALVIFNVSYSDKFSCRIRRVGMSFLEAIGACQTMVHDMLHS